MTTTTADNADAVTTAAWRTVDRPPLSDDPVSRIDRWWRAANYLSIGQIYLLDNPLLRDPLTAEHIKPRLLGHWGTTPGLNFLYAHLNRAIRDRDLDLDRGRTGNQPAGRAPGEWL